MKEKVVLAYSGGLDTSVAIKWINERYDMDVITCTVDVGSIKELGNVREKALRTGAIKAFVVDAKEQFVDYFVFPSLQAGAIYDRSYPLATALARPLIAMHLVDVAQREGATAVAHGCTGKGNDQVRFDVSTRALAPELKIIAPVREWVMTREEEIEYANKHGIPVPVTVASPYSIDENLWGRSIEAGVLEDPWVEPPEDAYAWTVSPKHAPGETEITIDWEQGIPVALDGQRLGGVDLIPTKRFSTWSIRPTPCPPASAFRRWISSTPPSRWPSSAIGTPCSQSTVISVSPGACLGLTVQA
jgi:argininosuccinate synthase